ncbi:hypothetical protein [Weissella bombi]|uniref:hypothetical protein n=1 Tax=Weissella bombi TaxID=1505725 RepID=UPI0010F66C1D|nr:hypothetical protein [Weissella bombi]
MENEVWYSFDPKTFKFNGVRFADDQPDNSTAKTFEGITNPVWNPTLNKWEGQTIDDYLAQQSTGSETNDVSNKDLQVTIASLVTSMAQQQKTFSTTTGAILQEIAEIKTGK